LHYSFRTFHLPQGAYDAFIECLSSYVYPLTFLELVRTIGPAGAFEAAASLKQPAIIIDRVTYMASCELQRPPAQVSLKHLISSLSIGGAGNLEEDRRCVVGAILERQVDSLSGSLWKPDVQSAVAGILSDCTSVYDSENRPIRRSGVILRGLELAYYTGTGYGDVQLAKSAEEIEALLSLEVHRFPSSPGSFSDWLDYRILDETLRYRTCLPYKKPKCTCGLPCMHIVRSIPNSIRSSSNTSRRPAMF
jgi:hypothetical protein